MIFQVYKVLFETHLLETYLGLPKTSKVESFTTIGNSSDFNHLLRKSISSREARIKRRLSFVQKQPPEVFYEKRCS